MTVVAPQTSLSFPGVEHLRQQLGAAQQKDEGVLVDLSMVGSVDYTAARGLCAKVKAMRKAGVVVEVCCANPGVLVTLEAVYGDGLEARRSLEEATGGLAPGASMVTLV